MKRRSLLHGSIVGLLSLSAGGSLMHFLRGSGHPTSAARQATPAAESSLHQLTSVWSTDRAEQIRLSALAGRFQVLAMMFTSCPGACPTLVRELQTFEKSLPAEVSALTGFVLVTIDPKRDTPAALREYRKKMGLAEPKWTLLRGAPEDLRELAATLGFNYEPNDAVGFVHSRLVTVLGPAGDIISQHAGVEDPTKVVAAIRKRI